MASTSVELSGADQLRQLSRDLRRHENGRELAKRLRRELRETAKPLVPAIRQNIRSLPSQNQNRRRGRPSTRAQLARAVTLQVRTSGDRAGVSVFMSPRKMPDGKKGLPGYFERVPGKTRLRHPTFGNREAWVTQLVPIQGYFSRTTRDVEDDARRRAGQVVDDLAREIEDG